MNNQKIIAQARKLGITNETKVRNLEIRDLFKQMRNNCVKYEESVRKLAFQFCLSEDSITKIVRGIREN